MLELEGISHRYDGTDVLRGVSLALEPRGLAVLMGPNGSGKTTLLRAAAGLLRPRRGKVLLEGRPIERYDGWSRGRLVAYMPQQTRLPDGMTVRQVVSLGRLPHVGWLGSTTRRDEEAVEKAMRAARVEGLADRPIERLSGGERQRVALARTLATGARYLLLDEPASHLDLHHQSALVSILRERAAAGQGVLMVVHDPNVAHLADRVALMVHGSIEADGPAPEVLIPETLRRAYGTGFDIVEAPDGRRAVVPSSHATGGGGFCTS